MTNPLEQRRTTVRIVHLIDETSAHSSLMAPMLKSLAGQFSKFRFSQRQIQRSQTFLEKFELQQISSVAIIRNGQTVAQLRGLTSRRKLKKFLSEIEAPQRITSAAS